MPLEGEGGGERGKEGEGGREKGKAREGCRHSLWHEKELEIW